MTDEPKTPSVLFESERREMDRLHAEIFRSIHRLPKSYSPGAAAEAYHPALLLSRIQQLENLVGVLTALLISPGRYHVIPHVDQKLLFEQMAKTYEAQLADLELHAMAHNAAYRPVGPRDVERAKSNRLKDPAVPIEGSNIDPRVKVGEPDAEE
jgi:hypothetical protein